MSDDEAKRGPADAKRIIINEDHAVDYWTDESQVHRYQARERGESRRTDGAVRDRPLRLELRSRTNGFHSVQ